MKELGLQELRVADIKIGDRLRQIDEMHAQMLAENIEQVGRLRQPIEVRRDGQLGWTLIAGGHRLRAVQILGREFVEAFVFEATDDEALMAEIDENLVRHELNPLDRAVFLAEREGVYLRLHPEAAHGGDRKSAGRKNQVDIVSTRSFADDVKERVGMSDRTVRRSLFIFAGLAVDVRSRIAGSPLARKQSELLALARLPHAQQRAVVGLLLAEPPQVRTVEEAKRAAAGAREPEMSPVERDFRRLVAVWGRVKGEAARQFVVHLRDSGALKLLLGEEAA